MSLIDADRLVFVILVAQEGGEALGVHHAESQAADEAGGQGNAGGHQKISEICLGVQMSDGNTLVGSSIVTRKCRVHDSILADPCAAVDIWRIATSLERQVTNIKFNNNCIPLPGLASPSHLQRAPHCV